MTCPYCSVSTAGEHEYNCQMNPENPMKSIPVESECCEKCSCPGIGFEYQSGAIHTMCSGDFCHDPSCPCHKSIPVEKYRITLDDAYNDIAPDIREKLSRSDLRHFVNGWNTFVNTKLSQALQAAVEEERKNCNCKRDENN